MEAGYPQVTLWGRGRGYLSCTFRVEILARKLKKVKNNSPLSGENGFFRRRSILSRAFSPYHFRRRPKKKIFWISRANPDTKYSSYSPDWKLWLISAPGRSRERPLATLTIWWALTQMRRASHNSARGREGAQVGTPLWEARLIWVGAHQMTRDAEGAPWRIRARFLATVSSRDCTPGRSPTSPWLRTPSTAMITPMGWVVEDAAADLYDGLVAPTLGASLLVETWRRGDEIPLACNNPQTVLDVQNVHILQSNAFKYTKDHSKFAVSTVGTQPFVCIGDINRMVPLVSGRFDKS